MPDIAVDIDVYKVLANRLSGNNPDPNSVLRSLLGLEPCRSERRSLLANQLDFGPPCRMDEPRVMNGPGWFWKETYLPAGTWLHADTQVGTIEGEVAHGGSWRFYWSEYRGGLDFPDLNPHRMDEKSPSGYASAILRCSVNGWWFWKVRRPAIATHPVDSDWVELAKIRGNVDQTGAARQYGSYYGG